MQIRRCVDMHYLLLTQIRLEFETLTLRDPSNANGDCADEYVEASLYLYQ